MWGQDSQLVGLLTYSKTHTFRLLMWDNDVMIRGVGEFRAHPCPTPSFLWNSCSEVKRPVERQAVDPGLIYSSFHYTTRTALKHPPCTELTPKAPGTLLGTGLQLNWGQNSQSLLDQTAVTLSQRAKANVEKLRALNLCGSLTVRGELDAGPGNAATPLTTPTPHSRAAGTPAREGHAGGSERKAGLRARHRGCRRAQGRGSELDRGGAAGAVGVAAG